MSNEKETKYMLEVPIKETIYRRICVRLDKKDLEKWNRDPDVKISPVDKEGNYAAPFKILDSYYLKETLSQNPLLQQLVDANKKGFIKSTNCRKIRISYCQKHPFMPIFRYISH